MVPIFARTRASRLPLLLALVAGGCGDDSPTGPPLPDLPRVATVTEWVESEPGLRQRGHFSYDGSGRLAQYEFGHVQDDGSTLVTLRIDYAWTEDGRPLEWVLEVRQVDGSFVPTSIQRYVWGAGSLVLETEYRDERTGEIETATATARLDHAGRIVRLTRPDTEKRYRWAQGDLVEVLSTPVGAPAQRLDLAPGSALNPLASLPTRPGISLIFYPDLDSRRAISTLENRVVGGTTAYAGRVVTEETSPAGVLTRRILELHNTSFPDDVRTRIVTEFTFVEGD